MVDAAFTIDSDRRILLVHAHPDDESIGNGATMARYVAEGAHVTLVTCTRGEVGEILVPDLAHLAADREDRLGEHRVGELAGAMSALGVTDWRWLGGEGRYRDSGMIGTPDNERPDVFWRADLREAADHLVRVIREVRPQVLVTYDDYGGYGHPDHIQAHRVATYAHALAGAPSYALELGEPWDVPKVYWTAMPESAVRDSDRALREAGEQVLFDVDNATGERTPYVADELVTTRVDGTDHVDQKIKAMQAHPTQIALDGPFFALSNNLGRLVWATEYYRLVRGTPGPVDPGTGYETDLFAGID